ncbi:glycosyltransferase family 8 protein [Acinetobacter sp. MD2]|uniref:glycosyltransferase family 8 protein n=1 Tax=Acinetobacter sp. MD2 TaxID=2600066 RepID=UPI002D1F2EB4|nr:glycosyltransferase [Acinetobacter sp. MD2]MEB3768266.1 glycosyl transferase family 8 [Acinetobacter sp. MD2]
MINLNNLVIANHLLSVSDFSPDINIAFAIDKNYLKPCGVTIFSIIKNNSDLKIKFHIFTTYFDESFFNELIAENIQIEVHILKTDYFDQLQTTGHFTTAIYYRLSIANILNNKVDKFIYLDADILCSGSIKELLNLELNDHLLCAVRDSSMKVQDITNLGLPKNQLYFNSGVLLINTKKWLDFKVFEKFTQLINKKNYEYPDQDVLNIILKDHTYYLDEKFNYFSKNPIAPVFTHFVSTPKPWSICAINNESYLEYYYQSPWRNIPLDAPRNYKEMKKYAKKLWFRRNFLQSFKWFYMYLIGKLKQ